MWRSLRGEQARFQQHLAGPGIQARPIGGARAGALDLVARFVAAALAPQRGGELQADGARKRREAQRLAVAAHGGGVVLGARVLPAPAHLRQPFPRLAGWRVLGLGRSRALVQELGSLVDPFGAAEAPQSQRGALLAFERFVGARADRPVAADSLARARGGR